MNQKLQNNMEYIPYMAWTAGHAFQDAKVLTHTHVWQGNQTCCSTMFYMFIYICIIIAIRVTIVIIILYIDIYRYIHHRVCACVCVCCFLDRLVEAPLPGLLLVMSPMSMKSWALRPHWK